MSNKQEGRGHIKAWLIAVMAVMLILPLLVEYFSILQLKMYYQFWPVLLLLTGILFVRRWWVASPSDRSPSGWTMWLLLLPSVLLMLFSLLYYMPWSLAFVWVLAMGMGALYLSCYRRVENLLGIWLLCLLCIRLPYQLQLSMIAWMENVSMETASLILDYLRVLHTVQGGVFAVPDYHFDIEAICSGWVSVVSTVALAALLAVVRNRKFLHSVSLLLLAVACSWILNILRTILVVGVQSRFGTDLLGDGYVLVYQLVSLVVALVLVVSADAFLAFLLGTITKQQGGGRKPRSHKGSLVTLWRHGCEFEVSALLGRFSSSSKMKPMSGVMTVIVFLGLAGLLGLEAVVVYHRPEITEKQFMYGEDQLSKIDETSVVFDRAGWEVTRYQEEKREFSSVWGAFSSIWYVRYHDVTMTMSLDYPFDDWHDIKACYTKIGWRIEDENTLDRDPLFKWGAAETTMTLPNGDTALLLCSHCDYNGDTVQPKPAEHGLEMFRYRLHYDHMTPPFGSRRGKGQRTFYQAQCVVTTPMPLDEATKEEIRMMYARFREQVREAIILQSAQNKVK